MKQDTVRAWPKPSPGCAQQVDPSSGTALWKEVLISLPTLFPKCSTSSRVPRARILPEAVRPSLSPDSPLGPSWVGSFSPRYPGLAFCPRPALPGWWQALISWRQWSGDSPTVPGGAGRTVSPWGSSEGKVPPSCLDRCQEKGPGSRCRSIGNSLLIRNFFTRERKICCSSCSLETLLILPPGGECDGPRPLLGKHIRCHKPVFVGSVPGGV